MEAATSMKGRIVLIAVCLVLLALFYVFLFEYDTGDRQELVIKNSRGEKIEVEVYTADSRKERENGLMGWESLAEDMGMLFVYGDSEIRGFWMENTDISLSIAYIDSEGTILKVDQMEPNSRIIYSPGKPFRYALEVNQGFYENNYITEGNRVISGLGTFHSDMSGPT